MKKLLALAAAVLTLSACQKTQTYTIQGKFDIPATFELGDTVIERGPITGYVFLYSLNQQRIDSAQIVDETFTMTGLADSKKPYYVYLISEYGANLAAIEPGQINVLIGEPMHVTGTPINDQIDQLMDRVDAIGLMLADEMETLGQDALLNEETFVPVYNKYSSMVENLIDSVYQQNTDNLIGVYCANVKTSQARSVAEMEEMLAPLSDYVKNSELIQVHLNYLRQVESQPHDDGEDSIGD